MSRPLRIQYPGALYHITARGNAREAIYRSDGDRLAFLRLMAEVATRFCWRFLGYCLMGNHYHLIVETVEPTLARGMRQLNGEYTRCFNREYRRVGHLLQGRYTAILVERETHLLTLVRYVVLNPVRAGLTPRADTWAWSSHRATAGIGAAPEWLAADEVLRLFAPNRVRARHEYARFVDEGMGAPSIWGALRQQIYLGSEAFVGLSLRRVPQAGDLKEVPRPQRRPPRSPLDGYATENGDRHAAMARACLDGGYSQAEVARHFGVHYATVSRAVRRATASGQAGTRSWLLECKT
jgi:putative transposase